MDKKEKLSGKQKFDTYYSEIYEQRWPSIKQSFAQENSPVLLSSLLKQPYYLDQASIIAASTLPLSGCKNILDMCAAPGGKSLILALNMDKDAHLVSNDRSGARRNRLITVLNNCLDSQIRQRITVTGHDSSKWSLYQKDTYDAILLDAPCSSERHVYNDSKALEIWGPNRPKQLATLQYAMLVAALDSVRINGYILYSTCSINPMENNRVIEKLFSKKSDRVQEIPVQNQYAQKLDYGSIIMPDDQNNMGPIFFCLLRRLK